MIIDKSSFYGVVSPHKTRSQCLVKWLTSFPIKNITERYNNTYIIKYYIIKTTPFYFIIYGIYSFILLLVFLRIYQDATWLSQLHQTLHHIYRHWYLWSYSYTYVFSLMTAISDSFLVWMASFVHTSYMFGNWRMMSPFEPFSEVSRCMTIRSSPYGLTEMPKGIRWSRSIKNIHVTIHNIHKSLVDLYQCRLSPI